MSRITPNMPVILHARDYDRWLDREETERLAPELLHPYEANEMEMYEANPKANSVRKRSRNTARCSQSRRRWRSASSGVRLLVINAGCYIRVEESAGNAPK